MSKHKCQRSLFIPGWNMVIHDFIRWLFFSAPRCLYATFVVRKISPHALCQSLSVLSLLTPRFFVLRADKTTRLLNKCFAAYRTAFSLWSQSSPEESLQCGKISLYSFRGVAHTKTWDESCPCSLRGVTDMKYFIILTFQGSVVEGSCLTAWRSNGNANIIIIIV